MCINKKHPQFLPYSDRKPLKENDSVDARGITREFAKKTIMKGMQSQLQCPGCTNLFKDPRVLACSHTYCRQCLEKAVKKRKKSEGSDEESMFILCPECSLQTELPGGDYSQLPYNFSIQHVMDLMFYYSSPEPVPLVYCGLCRKDGVEDLPPAVARCTSCSVFLCKQCFELHSIDDFTKLHTTLSITERGEDAFFSYLIPDETGVRNCKKHNWKIFTYFCITCSKGICDTCTKQDHKMHLYAKPEDLRADYAAYVRELLSRTIRLQRRTESAIRTTQDLMSGIQLLAATQIEEVLRTQDVLTSALDGRLSVMLQEADKCAKEANDTSGSGSSSNGFIKVEQGGKKKTSSTMPAASPLASAKDS